MSEFVKETLATVRIFHRTLFILCLAIIVFALAPNDLLNIQDARVELALVRGEKYEEFMSFVDKELRNAETEDAQNTRLEAICLTLEIECEFISYPKPQYTSFPVLQSSKLFEIDRFLFTGQPVTSLIGSDVTSELKNLVTFIRENGIDYISVQIEGEGLEPFLEVFAEEEKVHQKKLVNTVFQQIVPINLIGKGHPTLDALAHNEGSFTKLRKYWTDLRMLNPAAAEEWLAKREDTINKGLEFLGFRIERTTAIWVIPSMMLIGMLTLVVYMGNLHDAISSQESESYPVLPWIVLMVLPEKPTVNAIAVVLAIGSSTVVAIASGWLVVYRSWDVAVQPYRDIGVIGAASTTAVGLWATYLILRTRQVAESSSARYRK